MLPESPIKPAHFVEESPSGWIRASLPKFQETLRPGDFEDHKRPHALSPEELIKEQEARWRDRTGVEPADSAFTLIVPIHNEEKFLPSMLACLALADIPPAVPMQVLLITNGCTDRTSAKIAEFLDSQQEIQVDTLKDNVLDPDVEVDIPTVHSGAITYRHIDTPTRGKANALALGNQIALNRGDTIAMSLDANNFVEPDGIPQLFGQAHQAFEEDPDTVIVSGNIQSEKKSSFWTHIQKKGLKIGDLASSDATQVCGQFFSWRTSWMKEIDGPPRVATEDYALKVVAQLEGKKIEHDANSVVWGYSANNLYDRVSSLARYYRGKQQLLHLYPQAREMMEEEIVYIRPFSERVKALGKRIQKNRLWKAPLCVASFVLTEIAIVKGKHDLTNDPQNQSWEPIKSTKS